MEVMDDNNSPTGFEALFIKEEAGEQSEDNVAQSGLDFPTVPQNPSAVLKPYLREMDDLLRGCEELTGISFGSQYSEGPTEMSLNHSIRSQSKDEVPMERSGAADASSQAYLCVNTHMNGSGTEDQSGSGQLWTTTVINKYGVSTEFPRQTEMPVSAAGGKLSEAMLEYEGQLRGMLAMLESCEEEAGMDFEPQGWASAEGQEYVHISKGTTLVPIQQEPRVKLETQPMPMEDWAARHTEVSRDGVTVANGDRQNPLRYRDSMGEAPEERQEKSQKTDQSVPDPQMIDWRVLDSIANESMHCEGVKTRYMFDTDSQRNGTEEENTQMPAEERQTKMDTTELRSGNNKLEELGSQMGECIQEVEDLVKRRKELLAEVLELRENKNREETEEGKNGGEEWTAEKIDGKVEELMKILKSEEEGRREERKRELKSLGEERAEEERRMWKVNVERLGLQGEIRNLKRRLFLMVRECTHSQSILKNQQHEVELLKREEESLQALVLQLTEESNQLRSSHQQQLLELQAQLQAQTSCQASNSQEELTECRRSSCGDIQQYLQGGLKALENRYEPILLALLKRREAAAGALVKAKEQGQQLRAQVRPLLDQIQKLKLQRTCLEEKLKLIYVHHRENIEHYKETVCSLEESSRELKTELTFQKKKTKEMEELRDSLTKQVLVYRAAAEDQHESEQL